MFSDAVRPGDKANPVGLSFNIKGDVTHAHRQFPKQHSPHYPGVAGKVRNLGHSGTADIFKRQFQAGVSNMKRLVRFSLQFDCFDKLISILAENCGESLKLLDVSQSSNVTDGSLESFQKFRNLLDLNIFSCGFTAEGQARLLAGLPTLFNLRRGDFLCDAAEWMEWLQVEAELLEEALEPSP